VGGDTSTVANTSGWYLSAIDNMFKHKRKKIRLLPNRPDGSLTYSALELEGTPKQNLVTPIDGTKGALYGSKKMPIPNLEQMIEQRTWENGLLRQELTYQQRKHGASMYLLEEVRLAVQSLQEAMVNFQSLSAQIENESTEEPSWNSH
jgi:hypothetical protein